MELLRFYADHFARLNRYLADLSQLSPVRLELTPETREQIAESLEDVRHDLAALDLKVCTKQAEDLLQTLKSRFLTGEEIFSLQETLIRELGTRIFLVVASDRCSYFAEPTKKWPEIIKTFPDAQEDIEEMNKCFALSRYTAAVFHSLLVVEHGLIKLGHHIGVTDQKPGWDATYKRVDKLLNDRSVIPATLTFNFLEQTKARLDSMKLAWRNKVNHAAGRLIVERTGFTDVSAEEVIIACRSFMRHLAEGLPK